MNRLDQFLRYAQKVFALKDLLRHTGGGRPFPQIPTAAVLLSVLLGVVVRVSSYHDLAFQTQRRRWQHLCGLHEPISHDTFAYAMERVNLEDLRHNLWQAGGGQVRLGLGGSPQTSGHGGGPGSSPLEPGPTPGLCFH